MKSVNAVQVMVKGTCQCCGTPFQEIVAVGVASQLPAQTIEAPTPLPVVSNDAILSIVAHATGVSHGAIVGTERNPEIALARHLAAWIFRTCFGYSWARTAKAVGYREHTAVIHAVRRVQHQLDTLSIYELGAEWFERDRNVPIAVHQALMTNQVGSTYRLLREA